MPSGPLLHDLVVPLVYVIPRSLVAVLTERQGIDVVGDADRLLHVLVDDEDGVALLLQAGDLLVDFVDELRHEPDGGLVEQQGLRTGHGQPGNLQHRSEEHTSALQSLMRISYAVFCLKKKKITTKQTS